MKKIISLALAAAMVAGLAVTSFAAVGDKVEKEIVFGTSDDGTTLTAPTIRNVTDGVVDVTGAEVDADATVKPGSTFAIPVLVKVSTLAANAAPDADPTVTYVKATKDDLKGWKVKATWEAETGDIVTGVKIEEKKSNTAVTGKPAEKYGYYVVITTEKEVSTKNNYLYGELAIYKTSVKNAKTEGKFSYNFATAGYEAEEITFNSTVYAEGTTGEKPVRKFKGAGEEIIIFDGVGEYEINVAAQNALYLAFNTKLVNDVVDAYDYANLDFVNFPGTPKFYRTGVFYLYADIEDEEKFVYKLVDGVVSEVDCTYDEEMSAFKFALKNFPNSFIISDVELDIEAVEDVAPDTGAPAKPLPDTGR